MEEESRAELNNRNCTFDPRAACQRKPFQSSKSPP